MRRTVCVHPATKRYRRGEIAVRIDDGRGQHPCRAIGRCDRCRVVVFTGAQGLVMVLGPTNKEKAQ